jgi:hypothetical protein
MFTVIMRITKYCYTLYSFLMGCIFCMDDQ